MTLTAQRANVPLVPSFVLFLRQRLLRVAWVGKSNPASPIFVFLIKICLRVLSSFWFVS